MKSSVSIKFVDFWPTLNHHNNKFVNALKAKFNVEVLSSDSNESPDLLFYSKMGVTHYKYNDCIKIYYTGENDVPNFNECDYAMSFHEIDFDHRHIRYPLYQLYEDEYELAMNRNNIADDIALNRPFCSFLMRQHTNNNVMRVKIVEALEAYKPIAYGGIWKNNVGGPVPEKIPFISGYKFNLALENSVIPGYVTEKLIEPFAASTVPIYWGAPNVMNDFNPDSFINVSDYNSLDSFVRAVKDIDNDPKKYMEILNTPALIADKYSDFDARLSDFLCTIATDMKKRTTNYGQMGYLHQRDSKLVPFSESRKKNENHRIIQ